jgi:Flp pilus assembly protein TadD
MWRPDISAALLLALLLSGCGAIGGSPGPATNLDKAAVTRVANIIKQSGEYDAAARIQASYAAAHPDDRAAQISSGESALQAGETDKALENFQHAAQLAPDRVDAHYGLARAYLARNQPSEAAAEFQAVLTAEPKHVRALNGMGITLDQLGRGREAQNAYRTALAIAPDDRAIQNNLGLSLLLSGDYDQAVAELSALARQPGATARMRQNLALALGLRGAESDAARIASRDLDPASIADNQRFVAAVRRLATPGAAAMRNSGNAVAPVISN